MAYLCCQIRRWLALLILLAFHGGDTAFDIIEIILTGPLLILLMQYVAPRANELAYRPIATQCQFFLIPVLYYIYDYLTVVYTDWLYSGTAAVIEFMPFVCCAMYVAFLLWSSEEERRRYDLERDRDSLDLQVSQSMRELRTLREAQAQSAVYRHDLRHHLQYISACIDSADLSAAQEYIHSINTEIDAQKVVPYCENEPVNLILSAFAGRCSKIGIELEVHVSLPPTLTISAIDLCVLLSNGLENAMHACSQLKGDDVSPTIVVRGYEKNGKMYVQITNPWCEPVTFEDGLPIASAEGHGIGTRSILTITERYGGVCSFTQEDGKFILRASL